MASIFKNINMLKKCFKNFIGGFLDRNIVSKKRIFQTGWDEKVYWLSKIINKKNNMIERPRGATTKGF